MVEIIQLAAALILGTFYKHQKIDWQSTAKVLLPNTHESITLDIMLNPPPPPKKKKKKKRKRGKTGVDACWVKEMRKNPFDSNLTQLQANVKWLQTEHISVSSLSPALLPPQSTGYFLFTWWRTNITHNWNKLSSGTEECTQII